MKKVKGKSFNEIKERKKMRGIFSKYIKEKYGDQKGYLVWGTAGKRLSLKWKVPSLYGNNIPVTETHKKLIQDLEKAGYIVEVKELDPKRHRSKRGHPIIRAHKPRKHVVCFQEKEYGIIKCREEFE